MNNISEFQWGFGGVNLNSKVIWKAKYMITAKKKERE
jgi:hypothetical protein